MAVPAKVELIGLSRTALEVRAAVLEHFWAVRTVAVDEGQEPVFDGEVVVIFASMPGDVQQSWVDRARFAMPLVLIVRVDRFDSGPLAGADATVDDDQGPGALVSAIYELLTERGMASRGWALDPRAWVQ